MKYSMGDSLADYGFAFLEKLHSPIFLLDKNGTLKKVNEAGRKLLSVAQISGRELDAFVKSLMSQSSISHHVEYQILGTKWKKIKVVSKQLEASDYLLVELIR